MNQAHRVVTKIIISEEVELLKEIRAKLIDKCAHCENCLYCPFGEFDEGICTMKTTITDKIKELES